jgi:hypothetical protein
MLKTFTMTDALDAGTVGVIGARSMEHPKKQPEVHLNTNKAGQINSFIAGWYHNSLTEIPRPAMTPLSP